MSEYENSNPEDSSARRAHSGGRTPSANARAASQLRRRNVVWLSVAATLLVGIGAIGWIATPPAPADENSFAVYLAESFEDLDQVQAKHGDDALRAMHGQSEHQAILVLKWISSRRHASLYDFFFSNVNDPRHNVAAAALAGCHAIPSDAGAPFVHHLETARDRERDPIIRKLMQKLVTKFGGD